MVAAGAETAGAAVLPGVAWPVSELKAPATAAGPSAGLAGGTCNCESSADYTRRSRTTWHDAPAALFRGAANALILTGVGSGERVVAEHAAASAAARPSGDPMRDGPRGQMMGDIGDADRVALMQRLVALKIEHRDLDAVIHRLANEAAHDQLQLTRMKRRKLLLKDQIAWLERQIDPDVSA